jgi:hypothetical protein
VWPPITAHAEELASGARGGNRGTQGNAKREHARREREDRREGGRNHKTAHEKGIGTEGTAGSGENEEVGEEEGTGEGGHHGGSGKKEWKGKMRGERGRNPGKNQQTSVIPDASTPRPATQAKTDPRALKTLIAKKGTTPPAYMAP